MKAHPIYTQPDVRPDELAALTAFAKHHGGSWKDALTQIYWFNARVWRDPDDPQSQHGYVLHGIRNNRGPTWLYEVFKLPKEPRA